MPDIANMAALAIERLRSHGHQPFLTYYDEVTGERTELSYATFDNWVSKTANLLVEELQLSRGDRVLVALDGHWTAAVVVFACWKAGLAVACPGDGEPASPPGAAAVFRHEESPAGFLAGDVGVPTLAVGSGMAGRLTGPLEDDYAFADEVLAFADDYDDPQVDLAAEALLASDDDGRWRGWTQARLLAAGKALEDAGLGGDDRLLLGTPLDRPDTVVLWTAAFQAGASTVAVRRLDPAAFSRRAADERVTWAVLDGRQLDAVLDIAAPDEGAAPSRNLFGPAASLRTLFVPAGASTATVARVRDVTGLSLLTGDDVPAARGPAAGSAAEGIAGSAAEGT